MCEHVDLRQAWCTNGRRGAPAIVHRSSVFNPSSEASSEAVCVWRCTLVKPARRGGWCQPSAFGLTLTSRPASANYALANRRESAGRWAIAWPSEGPGLHDTTSRRMLE